MGQLGLIDHRVNNDHHSTVPEVKQGYPKPTALTVYQHLNPQNYTVYVDTT